MTRVELIERLKGINLNADFMAGVVTLVAALPDIIRELEEKK